MKKELIFGKQFAKMLGVEYKRSTPQEDMISHWDLSFGIKVDVKGLRKVRRTDAEVNENIHYIELKNVRGNTGWLYGEATHFAFETLDYWIIVNKTALQKFIAKKCRDKRVCQTPQLYQLYQRRGRQDCITMVKTLDLMFIAEQVIEKD